MKILEITEIKEGKGLKEFVEFPFTLYKGNHFWCPPLKAEEIKTLRQDMNPAFGFCEARYWMAFRDGKPVGRVAGIINNHKPDGRNSSTVRFGWIDFIDDIEVSSRLIETVKCWGKSKGKTRIHGPLGFTNMDAAGMLIQGFDEISAISTIYNYPYYAEHMEKLGFCKATDWVQYELKFPEEIPERVKKLTEVVLHKHDLTLLEPRTSKEILLYADKLFSLYNHTFQELYGFSPLSGSPGEILYKTLSWLAPSGICIDCDRFKR